MLTAGMSGSAHALTSLDYTPEKNDLFTTWSPTGAVVRNTSANFIGAGYDWSGQFSFTWVYGPTNWTVEQRGFFSPIHVARAAHMTAISTTVPNVTTTMDNVRTEFSPTASNLDFRTGYNLGVYTQYGYDLAISGLNTYVAPDSGVAVYAVPDFENYSNQVFFLTGHGGKNSVNSPRVMVSKVTNASGNQNTVIGASYDPQGFSSAQLQGGDSAYSAYIGYTNPAGEKQLLLLGVNSALGSMSNYLSIYGSTAGINASNGFMVKSGFALQLVGKSATTWTGASSSFTTAGNWTTGVPLATNYVTFDSAVSSGQTVDFGGASRAMRGLIFNPGTVGEAFTFQSGTLALGRGGLANFSAETQTFSTAIQLTDHQVWDATKGGYAIQNGVDLNGKLLVVQGDFNTAIQGAVVDTSGTAAGLSKYGLGTLTLGSAATYTGTTWLYGGTLALGAGGALPTRTALILGNSDSSRLELNGTTQTFSRLANIDSISGGQGTVDLGAGGQADLYLRSVKDVFTSEITGGTAGTTALKIAGWQADAQNYFYTLAVANSYLGKTFITGQAIGENGGSGLVLRIAHTGALGATGAGNDTTIQYTNTSSPKVFFVAGGTYQEALTLDLATTNTQTLAFQTPGQQITLAEALTVSRRIQTAGSQLMELQSLGDTALHLNAIQGELGLLGVAAAGSDATALRLRAVNTTSTIHLDGEISDGTIKGAGNRGLGIEYWGEGRSAINHSNTYTGDTHVRGTVIANVNALAGVAGAFGNATSAITLAGRPASYAQAIYAGSGVTIGRAINVLNLASGATSLGVENATSALFSGAITLDRQVNLNAGIGGQVEFSGSVLQGAGSSAVTKTGAGTVVLSGSNTYTGGTSLTEGTLVAKHNNALGTSGTVQVNAGSLLVDTGVTLANANLQVAGGTLINHGTINSLNFASGTLGGRGLYNVSASFDSALTDFLAPGASTGLTTFGTSQTWSGFTYQWEIQDFAAGGTAGTAFDSVAINGSLTLDGTAFTLEIHSLDSLGNEGPLFNYQDEVRQWTILSTTAGITGFDSSEWTIDASAFLGNHPGGAFNLAQSGNDLLLNYTPVPEPSAAALLGLATLLTALRRRRRTP